MSESTDVLTLSCATCAFTATTANDSEAEDMATNHQLQGKEHKVTCTRPAHHKPGCVPVVVFESQCHE
jgi:hypothetical protein